MRHFFRNNGLSLTLLGLFLLFIIGQSITGFLNYNDDQQSHKQPQVTYGSYLMSGDFIESVFENWESEFLQMGTYVILTALFFQKGSSESKNPDEEEAVEKDPAQERARPDAPLLVRKGGAALNWYKYSLSIALFLLFFLSFGLHAIGGSEARCQEQLVHGEQCGAVLSYLITPRFWFESFQNWQSEFLSMGVFILLTIFLRHQGSPESKPVYAPHKQTGSS